MFIQQAVLTYALSPIFALYNFFFTDPEEEITNEYILFNDEEPELEALNDEIFETKNMSESFGFTKFFEELTKKFEGKDGLDQNCTGGGLLDFCNKYGTEIMNAVKDFWQKDPPTAKGGVQEKKFIEPDISDDEDSAAIATGMKRKALFVVEDGPAAKKRFESVGKRTKFESIGKQKIGRVGKERIETVGKEWVEAHNKFDYGTEFNVHIGNFDEETPIMDDFISTTVETKVFATQKE